MHSQIYPILRQKNISQSLYLRYAFVTENEQYLFQIQKRLPFSHPLCNSLMVNFISYIKLKKKLFPAAME